ncbi:MAG TPA: NUDIX hydrolase, partial [Elusimicrobiota bacterium]|nr:NUDIX hydrolase [Elusimicrobiota bacterium]
TSQSSRQALACSSGGTATREYLGHPGAVAVVAVSKPGPDPEILLVRQYRYPVKETTLELPAGKIDPGEKPAACVNRELEEETGVRAGRVKKILAYWPTPAFANEVIHLYVARDLKPGRFSPDEDEIIEPIRLKLSEVLRRIRAGKIKDSKTVIGLLAYDRWRDR